MSELGANSVGLKAISTSQASINGNLLATISSIQDIDQVKLQAQLQQLNNEQSTGYYLISQMNSAASAMLSIFRA